MKQAKIEKLDVRTYKASNDQDSYILRPMKKGAYRWGMFYLGDEGDDANVVNEDPKEIDIIGHAMMTLMG